MGQDSGGSSRPPCTKKCELHKITWRSEIWKNTYNVLLYCDIKKWVLTKVLLLQFFRVAIDLMYSKDKRIDDSETLIETYLKNPELDVKDVVGMACDALLAGIDTVHFANREYSTLNFSYKLYPTIINSTWYTTQANKAKSVKLYWLFVFKFWWYNIYFKKLKSFYNYSNHFTLTTIGNL